MAMPDSNIGGLPRAASINDDSLLVMEQQGDAKHFEALLLKNYARQGVDALVAAAQQAAEQAAQAAKDAEEAAGKIQDVTEEAEAAIAAAQAAEAARQAAVLAAQAAEQAARLAAETAAQEAASNAVQRVESALQDYVDDAEQAKTAAEVAAGNAAVNVEDRLKGYVSDAENAKNAAEQAAGNAANEAVQQAETQLQGYVTEAENAKTAAQSAAGTAAQDAVSEANTQLAGYVSAAQEAQKAAGDEANRAELAAVRQPTIRNGTWWIWNSDLSMYEDSGLAASGSDATVTWQSVLDALGYVPANADDVAQADHAENNPENPAHVLNRTHWKEVIGEDAEIVPLQSATFSPLGWATVTGISGGMKEGIWYAGTMGGLAFEGRCKKWVTELYIGNGHLLDSRLEDTGEWFCINALGGVYYDFTNTKPQVGASLNFEMRSVQEVTWHKLDKNYLPDDLGGVKTVNGNAPDKNGNVVVNASITAENIKAALGYTPANETAVAGKLDKVAVDIRREIAFGSTGKLMIGKFKVYDTQVTVDITATTGKTYNGKLVIATQNYYVRGATVYGDADNSIAPNLYIKPCSPDDPYIEVYFSPQPWSKNVIHIYGNSIHGTSDICTSVTAVPETATLKPVNALTSNFAAVDSTGGGGTTSWNDLTDRPFYTETGDAILPETTVELDPDYGEGSILDVLDVKVGNVYTVNWNGTAYICTAVDSPDLDNIPGAVLGNLGAIMGEEGTGEPFFICALPSELAAETGVGGFIMALDGSASVTLSIHDIIVHPIDPMYLPKMVVNFTMAEGGGLSDKTTGEVLAAIRKGYLVEGRFSNPDAGDTYVLQLAGYDATGYVFSMYHPNVKLIVQPIGEDNAVDITVQTS